MRNIFKYGLIFILGAIAAISASLLYIGRDGYLVIYDELFLSQSRQYNKSTVSLTNNNPSFTAKAGPNYIHFSDMHQSIFKLTPDMIAQICILGPDEDASPLYQLRNKNYSYHIWLKDEAVAAYTASINAQSGDKPIRIYSPKGLPLGRTTKGPLHNYKRTTHFLIDADDTSQDHGRFLALTLNNHHPIDECDFQKIYETLYG